jgi:LysR family transcriptional regulator for metE and metH
MRAVHEASLAGAPAAPAPSAPRWLEVRHLRLVQAVAREGGVTRAARSLHLSQSAVSHQLVDLERELGVRLFDRVGKRLILAAPGAALVRWADRVLPELARAERELHDARTGSRTDLRVTTSCYTTYRWLPSVLPRFAAAFPRFELRILLEATRRAVEALAEDEVDLAITTEPPRTGPYARERLFVEDVVALVHRTDPLAARAAARRALRWTDLRGATLLVHEVPDLEVSRLRRAVEGTWRAAAEPSLEVRRIPLTESIVELARARVGVGIVGRSSVPPYARGDDLVLLPIVPRAQRTFWAVWRIANPRRLPLAELVALVRGATPVLETA